MLGLNDKLSPEVLGTLLGGISGYLLGRASRAASAPAERAELKNLLQSKTSGGSAHPRCRGRMSSPPHERVIEQLVRYNNVYADTSGVRRFDYLVQAVKRAGAHKLLFGSDGPWLHPGVDLYKIVALTLPPEHEALILGRNAIRLILSSQVARPRPYLASHDRFLARRRKVR
jgi:Amidohydrolase